MTKLDFATFCNRYAGQPGWVVGRGPTKYRYQDLATVDGPVFFINDSVSQETHLPPTCDSFFFAHDLEMAVWLGKIRSTAVLVVDFPFTSPDRKGLLSGPHDPLLQREGKVVLYRQFGEFEQGLLLERSQLEIARSQQLYINIGTINPLLHFAWYVGCSKLYLIGCDGLPNIGYDPRLPNLSSSKRYGPLFIRRDQDKMLHSLKVPVEYLGTPPHLVQLECKMIVQDHKQCEIIDTINEVVLLTHTTKGSLGASLERVDNSENTLHLRLQSNSIQEFLEFLKCNAVRRLQDLIIQRDNVLEWQIFVKSELC
jgi:hypothetical protein